MRDEMREEIRAAIKEAMQEGGKLALDSAVRLIGVLVQQFTVRGNPQEAAGASAAMQLMKKLRDDSDSLYAAPSPQEKK